MADWGGAGCWGRVLNTNFIRMGMTASVAWSLVWSAYPSLECYGNGLMYAYEPWSGSYEVSPPVWATAHTTQFVEPGWRYLRVGEGAGELPLGGTYVTLLDAETRDFSVVIETLQGRCFYNNGCFHHKEANATQRLRVKLVGNMQRSWRSKSLNVWETTKEAWFVQRPSVDVDERGVFYVNVPVDALVTVTTTKGQSKAGTLPHYPGAQGDHGPHTTTLLSEVTREGTVTAIPTSQSFPLPYSEDFESYSTGKTPAFFADQGGAFEVVETKDRPQSSMPAIATDLVPPSLLNHFGHGPNRVLEQVVTERPIAWIGSTPDPFTMLGGVNWTDYQVRVSARQGSQLAPERHKIGLCARISRYQFFSGGAGLGYPEGYCLHVNGSAWTITAASRMVAVGEIPASSVPSSALAQDAEDKKKVPGPWRELQLHVRGARITASVDGHRIASFIDTSYPFGQIALACGYERCQFDDLVVKPVSKPPPRDRALLKSMSLATFDYHKRSCEPPGALAPKRNDFTGFLGLAFRTKRAVEVEGLGRLFVPDGVLQMHNISLIRAKGMEMVASVALPLMDNDQDGVERTDDGWVFARLKKPRRLPEGETFWLVTNVAAGGDFFYDHFVRIETDDDVDPEGAIYFDGKGWHNWGKPQGGDYSYGPVNLLLAKPPGLTNIGAVAEPPLETNLPRSGAAPRFQQSWFPFAAAAIATAAASWVAST